MKITYDFSKGKNFVDDAELQKWFNQGETMLEKWRLAKIFDEIMEQKYLNGENAGCIELNYTPFMKEIFERDERYSRSAYEAELAQRGLADVGHNNKRF